MILFDKPGYKNTEILLDVVEKAAEEHGIAEVVVASTYGDTGLVAARRLCPKGVKVTVVTHNVGFKEPGTLEMEEGTRRAIEELGAKVFTGTMPFRNIGTAIRERQGYSQQDLIANTLRIFGQGIKVCVEIVLMAADAGLISTGDVIAVAGTGRGADTAAVIAPMPSNRLFDLKVRAVLAKPRDW